MTSTETKDQSRPGAATLKANHNRVTAAPIEAVISNLGYYAGKKNRLVQADPDIAFKFTPDCIESQRLAR